MTTSTAGGTWIRERPRNSVRLSYNAGLESPSAKGTVFWLVNSGSSASSPFSWQRTRRVRPDQAVTAVEQISLWLHLEGVVRPGTTCDPRSYAESWGLRRKSRLGGLEYDFCFPPHLVLFLDFLHLETNARPGAPHLRISASA